MKFWPSLIPSSSGNSSWGNNSIDVAVKGCFEYYDITACVRNSLLAFLGFVTLCLCIIRIIRLHLLHHPQIHQYLVFYSAVIEVVLLIVKWVVKSSLSQLEFVASYLKMIQFIILCHFNWSLVSRILHQKRLINWIILPFLVGFFVFLTTITVLAVIYDLPTWVECLAPHWLLLSLAEFFGVQSYVVAGVYITKKINSISALDSFKAEQKRDLWSVIVTYELSSVVSLSYYATLFIVGNCESGCSGVFGNAQEIYSPVYGIFTIIKYFIPIWVMWLVFYPTRGCMSREDSRLLGLSCDGSTTSVFSPGTRHRESYRQMIVPVSEAEGSSTHASIKRSNSSPAIFSKPFLTPISEEDSFLPPSHLTPSAYGATDSSFPSQVFASSRTRSRHDSGRPRGKNTKIHVSLNQGSDEYQNLLPSSSKRA